MRKKKSRFRQWVERLLFAVACLGGGGYALYWASPLNLMTLDATVAGATWLHDRPSGGSAQYGSGYDAAFTVEGFVCGFRYGSFWTGRETAETAFSKGDAVTLVLARGEFAEAARSLGRDCRTGERLPGTLTLMVPSPLVAPRLIEPLDVWRGGWVVMHWLPHRWLIWGLGAVLTFIGLVILLAPLIDRFTDRNRKPRLGMKALRAYDEETRQRRNRDG
ncbi:MAG: hypothetical protein QF893_00995 [Alphaproteobacteria bacterium]|jgi:hypothetical protein|nr:hypothetical protein [Alphaproteobacteria bacterium]